MAATNAVASTSLYNTEIFLARRVPIMSTIWLLEATLRYCAVTVIWAPPAMSTEDGNTERMVGIGA
jgi:hypothetical protein